MLRLATNPANKGNGAETSDAEQGVLRQPICMKQPAGTKATAAREAQGEPPSASTAGPAIGAAAPASPPVESAPEQEPAAIGRATNNTSMGWVGCFRRHGEAEAQEGGAVAMTPSLFRPLHGSPAAAAHTTTAVCAQACREAPRADYALLRSSGLCFCGRDPPAAPAYEEVYFGACGKVCAGEGDLEPTRFCGGPLAFAVYYVGKGAPTSEPAAGASVAAKTTSMSNATRASTPPKQVLKGICYAPAPLKQRGVLPDDDFMSGNTSMLWGQQGRGDLRVIKSLGANTVRLYGNDASVNHTEFLEEALSQELQVIAGISDYPWLQMPGNCMSTQLNCYQQIKEAYKANLQNGFLLENKTYHPALRMVILMNEPDLKIQPVMNPVFFTKALVTGIDAVLDAEKEMDVRGPKPSLTVTFSFGLCGGCARFGQQPGLGQMAALREALLRPSSAGYQAKNDLAVAYKDRFVNSVNTANPADDFKRLFLDTYDSNFQGIPVFIAEYHHPHSQDQTQDLQAALSLAANGESQLMGLAFFEFQARYDKGGPEMEFGMFGLGEEAINDFDILGETFNAWCLSPMKVPRTQKAIGIDRYCRHIVLDMDFESNSAWSLSVDRVASPRLCCSRCSADERCQAWTWEKSPNVCRLQGARPAKEVPRRGFVSGLPTARWKIEQVTFGGRGGVGLRDLQDADDLVPSAVARAFGGPGVDYSKFCPPMQTVGIEL
jgi:hypothetical protein